MNLTEISVFEVLDESFILLREEPILFVPKLFSALVGALWFIGFLESFGSRMAYLVSYPVMILFSVAVSVLISVMVKQKKEDNGVSLAAGLEDLWSRKRQVVYTSLALTVIIVLISMPMAIGLTFYLLIYDMVYLVIGFLLTFLMMLVFAIGIYFLPATLVSEDDFLSSFRESFRSATEHSRDVLFLTLLSFALLLLASLSSGLGEVVGYAGFVFGRLLSAVFSTYIYVVSPSYYFAS